MKYFWGIFKEPNTQQKLVEQYITKLGVVCKISMPRKLFAYFGRKTQTALKKFNLWHIFRREIYVSSVLIQTPICSD
jgi:hypothetical protein